jgi:hypothetical protein
LSNLNDSNKTITYITNAKEEGVVKSLSKSAGIDEEDLFSNAHLFVSLKQHYLKEEPDYLKLHGLGDGKTTNLKQIYLRIQQKTVPKKEDGYFSLFIFSTALDRYKSLLDRNYIKTLFEIFNHQVYYNFKKSWTKQFDKKTFNLHKDLIKNDIGQPQYKPIIDWLNIPISAETLEKIKETYEDMKEVRFRNFLFEFWEEAFATELKEFKKHYHGKLCELPIDTFIEFYGPNTKTSRKCEYCTISELDIEQLDLTNQIFTKRFYSRGSTMEIDKRDPSKNYETSNLVMSCYWCNNAKTDEFTEEEFLVIAKGIRGVWEKRLKK